MPFEQPYIQPEETPIEKQETPTVLGSVKKNLKKVVQLGALIGALSATSNDVIAQDVPKQAASTEKESVQKVGRKREKFDKVLRVDISKVTESGQWAGSAIDRALLDLKNVGSIEESQAFIKDNYRQFVNEYYQPKKGLLIRGPYGLIRNYSSDDHRVIVNSAIKFKEILDILDGMYKNPSIETDKAQLDDIIEKSTHAAVDLDKVDNNK